MTKQINIVLFLFLSYLLSACSVQPVTKSVAEYPLTTAKSLSNLNTAHYWWSARFKMNWTEEHDSLDFSNNLIIAHQIINPIVENYQQDIKLWRFHRRAAKDSTGQQFSFIFYATAESAQDVFQQIQANPLSVQLINEKVIEKMSFDNPELPKNPDIKDTSDKNWSIEIQKSWPYYIMGVSILWLDLLNQEALQEKIDPSQSITIQQQQYKKINEKITQHWKTQGRHAFFHHISGIFGYESLEVRF